MPNIEDAAWSPLPKTGSRVVVTGAAGGLGRALIAALSDAGAQVIGLDLPAAVTDSEGDRLIGVDVADESAAQEAIAQAAERLGGLDALVGAAGVVDTIHRAASFPAAAFRSDVEANLIGQFNVAQACYPHLKESGSSAIVFVSSQAGLDGLPGQASYAASKAGIVGLAASLAMEWVGDGIRVNAVAPGLFATPKVLGMPQSARDRMLAGAPMRRIASLDEIVGPILFLLSPASGYITGRTLRLDGGAGLTATGLFR